VTLVPGSRVGPYDIVEPLGAGGMGEVFRGRDARLKRDVALKVLPSAAAGDVDRRGRFEREAQVLASRNHTTIAQIFGVEISGDAPVIVMELVEGPTLADRLAAGALPIDEALGIARQICEGLEAAHDRGIIHRDLKPANIKVRPDGTIKILDFGLARVLTEEASPVAANSPTVLGRRTEVGIILGTAAYMSPEQARGRAVDKRADIWAFGCILFEMLTGTSTFSGESTTDILAEVVQRDPDWQRLPPHVPEPVVELLLRCLQKNPKDRLRDITDARFEIEHALRAPAGGGALSSHSIAAAPASRTAFSGLTIAAFAAGAAAVSGIVAASSMLRTNTAVPPAPIRTVIALPAETTVALSRGSAIALSPDGRFLTFAGNAHGKTQLYLRPLDRFESQPLPGTDGAANPFFSPDGRWIGFFADAKLKKVSVDGGAPVTVADARTPRGEAWGPNDTIFLTPTNAAGLSRVPALGGKLEPVTTLRAGELSHRWPRLLPDGSAVLYTIWNDTGWEPSRIAAQRLSGGDPTVLVEGGGGYGRYIRDAGRRGYLVYARSEGLLAAPFDESRLALTGQAVPVVDGVITNLSGGAHFDLSASGTLAYVPGTIGEADRDLVWVGLDGKSAPALRIHGMSRTWMLSPDGTRLVRNNTTGGPSRDIWIDSLTGGPTMRLTNSADNFATIWSSDGKWVAYAKGISFGSIYRRPSDGREAEERLTTGTKTQAPSSFSPDGKSLAYTEFDSLDGADLWILTMPAGSGAGSARPFVKTNFYEGNAVFSPDGRWLAYQSNGTGRFEVFVRSFPDGEQSIRVSLDGGMYPMWSPGGTELFFRGTDNTMMAASVTMAPTFQASKPRVLFDAIGYESVYGVSPDGRRLLMMQLIPNEQSATQVHLVLNFLTELRQRVR
jgi:Tol biopolymer transport system component